MINKVFKTAGKIFLIFFLSSFISCHPAEKPKPNVIFVLTDQWRAQAMGYAGDPNVKTPNLDLLAEENLNFTLAISSIPVCSPARASILTGQYPLTHGVFYNDKPLKSDALTIAEVFKQNGYKTGYIGKWHVNGHQNGEDIWEARNKPIPAERRQGFDYWKVMECTHKYNESVYFDEENRKQIWEGYDVFPQTDSAIAFIRRTGNEPFFLVLSWGPPHNPYMTAPEKYLKMYADTSKLILRPNVPDSLASVAKSRLAGYYAHCTAMDDNIKRLQDAIRNSGLEENTIFVFTSDHGDMLYSHGRFAKQKPWDESILVPFILKYPDKFKKPLEVDIPFVTVDIMPTLLGLCNIEIPESVEGTDFSPFLSGKKNPDIEGGLLLCPVPFHEWSRIRGGREYRGIRTRRYTYVKDLNGPWLLYDNKEDPYQMVNLVNDPEYIEIQNQLETELQKLLGKTHDEFKDGDYYMKKWNYTYDKLDSMIFSPDYPR